MSEMIERVARAIEPHAWAAHDGGWQPDDEHWRSGFAESLETARAVIEAMREPAGDMTDAGRFLLDASPMEFNQAWERAIDASLADTQK